MSAQEVEVVEPEKKSKAIAKREPRALEAVHTKPSMEEVLMRAVEQGADIETIERLAALVERAEARDAKRQFESALAAFQLECPVIPKKRKVHEKNSSTVRYAYAAQEDLDRIIKPLLGKHGLSYTTRTEIVQKGDDAKPQFFIKAVCRARHAAGYDEDTPFEAPIDFEAYMTHQQKYASASTFCERYATKHAFGLVFAGEDDDGQAAGKISPKDAREAKQPVRQPQQTPTAQKAANGPKEKVQLEPAGEGEAIDDSTVKGLTKAMESGALGQADFTKRFPTLTGLEQVKKSDSRAVMSWIADPQKN